MDNYFWFLVSAWAFGLPFMMGFMHQTYQRDMDVLPEAIYPDWMIKAVMVGLSIIWPVVLVIAILFGIFSLPAWIVEKVKTRK